MVRARVPVSWRILIVEDEAIIALDYELALLDAGHAVVGVASTFSQAIAVCESRDVDIALMDINLAGEIDGVTTAMELRDRFDLACIFISAQRDDRTRKRAREARPLGWVAKPLPGPDMARRVCAVLAESEASLP